MSHVEDRLIDYLSDEVPPGERREIAAHLEACGGCRAALADFERLANALAVAPPPAPPVHWGAYRAELRDRLERRAATATPVWLWGLRPARVALAAGLVGVMVYLGGPGPGGQPPGGEPGAMDEAILASRLDLISRLDLVQRLDLLEDLDVIGRLDRLSQVGEG